MYNDQIILITGGTGSIGNALVKKFIQSDAREIRIFSRDEQKQDEMRIAYHNPKLRFFIGDVRDPDSLDAAVDDVDILVHTAALKQVPACEYFPMEAVKTNVSGCENVLDAAIRHQVKHIITLSTDKAVYPTSAMGYSKALGEKVMIARSRNLKGNVTRLCGARCGNVMASRGSVIPIFLDQIKAGIALTVTNPEMTRFMMTIEDAAELVLFALHHGENGDIFIHKSPSIRMDTLARAMLELFSLKNEIRIIGSRPGEKTHETLLNKEEMDKAIDLGEYFRIPASDNVITDHFSQQIGSVTTSNTYGYTSIENNRIDVDQAKAMLLKLDIIQKALEAQN